MFIIHALQHTFSVCFIHDYFVILRIIVAKENMSIQSPSEKTPLIGMSLQDFTELALSIGLPKFSGGQICQWVYQKRASDIEQMTNLSKAARAKLSERYCVGTYPPSQKAVSTDGTVKYLFAGAPERDVEAVFIPDRERATLCVPSQAGCKMACKFCMTGKQGFHGNLSAAQIINQIMSIDDSEALTNVVFMGMGEPTDNLDAVLKAIDILTAKWGFAWSPKRITVSSIGRIDELKRLIESTRVHIAISVHSPMPGQRQSLMPVEKAYPVTKVMNLLRQYDFAHQRRLSLEYILWGGLNDSPRHADALASLIKGSNARVNLIRYHEIPGVDLPQSNEQAMVEFRDRLNAAGITATIRASRGEDIMAACGMLAGKDKLKI